MFILYLPFTLIDLMNNIRLFYTANILYWLEEFFHNLLFPGVWSMDQRKAPV